MERQWDQVALSRAVLTTYIHTLRSGRAVGGIACVAFADDWKMFYLKRFDLHPIESRGGSCSTAQKARAHPATFCRALLGAYLRYRKLSSLVEALFAWGACAERLHASRIHLASESFTEAIMLLYHRSWWPSTNSRVLQMRQHVHQKLPLDLVVTFILCANRPKAIMISLVGKSLRS